MSYTDLAERNLESKWNINNGIAKIFTVNRQNIDEDSEESDAWELIFIDDGGVRRHETLIDCAYGRFEGLTEADMTLLNTCPDKDVVSALMEYIND